MGKKTFIFLLCILLSFSSATAELSVTFIDVGQGDAILLSCDGEFALLDAGPVNAGPVINQILNEAEITSFKAVIASHGHDDHIGGMQQALTGLTAERIYTSPTVPMSFWLNSIIPSLGSGNSEIVTPQPLETFSLGTATVTFLNTDDDTLSLNNRSTVIRIDYENTSFLLVGDAEGDEENALLAAGVPLSANVLKLGHHGGLESTSLNFLNAVSPDYAIISVGTDNAHGHPSSVVLSILATQNISVYRTDLLGTVTCISDGNQITIDVKKVKVQ